MNNPETRIQKWMEYRDEILENKNIRESLINTNEEFKNQYQKISDIFVGIDFLSNKNNMSSSRIDLIDLKSEKRILEIDKHLEDINIRERAMRNRNIENITYNLKKYCLFIKKYFANEYSGGCSKDDDIKVTKINLKRKI